MSQVSKVFLLIRICSLDRFFSDFKFKQLLLNFLSLKMHVHQVLFGVLNRQVVVGFGAALAVHSFLFIRLLDDLKLFLLNISPLRPVYGSCFLQPTLGILELRLQFNLLRLHYFAFRVIFGISYDGTLLLSD